MTEVNVVSIEMGYGHLRAAYPLADQLRTEVFHVDEAPLADAEEQKAWEKTRHVYEATSRISQLPVVGVPLRFALNQVTDIPHLHPYRDLSRPTLGVRLLERAIDGGIGQGMVAKLRQTGATLLTTFYSPAIIADRFGCRRVFCVVTDSDINRVWAPKNSRGSAIQYLVPSKRARRRLESYGVPGEHIHFTGFPLPPELLGGPDLPVLRDNLARRLVRLDPKGRFRDYHSHELEHFLGELPDEEQGRSPRLMYAVGGAGAQVELVATFLPRLRHLLVLDHLRLTLVAGVRSEVVEKFEQMISDAGLDAELGRSIEILHEPTFETYYRRFNERLQDTDILWTKPSEMTFYAALGLPLIFSWPVGVHERYNRRWAVEAGAGLKQRDPRYAGDWLAEMLSDGTLAAAAWSGFMRLPKFGTYRIVEALGK
ncbi:hypothetical protein FIV42_09185 [Persicimonas caeni]|uniref:Glycosyl transferase family 28 C-terminal domain-containing protein n=1 Tax=Persicimonas caeni TaxID=2292766 RepID=A0A4Y6PS14_PERCE|nr:hypothetical protein [Persicimonas caeni]QDG50899.1 hypothetical protein FIV42_09185 [Persicimonas caeni]QED32120.1 hypothetical protein FRD00_09180 [Persicimonas caeni]